MKMQETSNWLKTLAYTVEVEESYMNKRIRNIGRNG